MLDMPNFLYNMHHLLSIVPQHIQYIFWQR